jgi:poly(3-hydroxybutyrate) depolymerase
VRRYDYRHCEGGVLVTLFAIEGGDHSWPGVRSAADPDRPTADIQASEEILDFFTLYPIIDPSLP